MREQPNRCLQETRYQIISSLLSAGEDYHFILEPDMG